MKKLLVLLCAVFMYSCSSDEHDSSNGNSKSGRVNPPAWIQGTWSDTKGKTIQFTKNDLIIDPNGNPYSAKGEIAYFIIKDEDPEIVESATETTYNLEFKESASSKKNFKFTKISDTELESTGYSKGIYTKK